jgi:hypothetical protein
MVVYDGARLTYLGAFSSFENKWLPDLDFFDGDTRDANLSQNKAATLWGLWWTSHGQPRLLMI